VSKNTYTSSTTISIPPLNVNYIYATVTGQYGYAFGYSASAQINTVFNVNNITNLLLDINAGAGSSYWIGRVVGGYSGIFINSVSQSNTIVIAGGGGANNGNGYAGLISIINGSIVSNVGPGDGYNTNEGNGGGYYGGGRYGGSGGSSYINIIPNIGVPVCLNYTNELGVRDASITIYML
jgi:hypothetical protein